VMPGTEVGHCGVHLLEFHVTRIVGEVQLCIAWIFGEVILLISSKGLFARLRSRSSN
jgi:hypothetical protein